ncbi:permease prefix domain 1-containing protein [Phytomonospora sp. NPDC050363]|uniref:permease prefix domain 1-containing protein n=1 Tax=Phytomonospora sp. NPDC050363 TaxID=3155642 RepID=UPI0033CF42D0
MTRAAQASAGPIPAYLAELRSTLHGSRRRVEDMLREARHGLEDTAEAYEADGMAAGEAARAAVEEFGTVAEIAPDYQVELAATATKRSLLFFALLVPAGNVMAWLQWREAPPLAHQPPPGTWILSLATDLIAWTVVGASLLGVLAMTFGAGRFVFRPAFARAAATAIFTVLVTTFVSGLALTFMFASARGIQPAELATELPGIGYLVAWVGLTWCGIRCLRTGRHAERLRDRAPVYAG